MGAISKSDPIFRKLSTHHSGLNSVCYPKIRATQKISRDFRRLFTSNRTKIYMGAISKSEPIFTKLGIHHSRPYSLRCAKFRANRQIYRDIGTQFTLNRTKIYMGAISKSEPIFMKLGIHHYRPYSLRCAKFRANRKIYRDFGTQFTLNRTKIYMGAISKSEPIFMKFYTHHSRPNSLRCANFRANRKIYRDRLH